MAVPEQQVHYLEIVTPNLEGARDLYHSAFGWFFEGPIPELGNAWIASMPSGGTCGIRAPMHEQERETVRNYFRVSNLAETVEQAAAAGAVVALPPTEIPGRGMISIVMVGGIEQGFWQLDS